MLGTRLGNLTEGVAVIVATANAARYLIHTSTFIEKLLHLLVEFSANLSFGWRAFHCSTRLNSGFKLIVTAAIEREAIHYHSAEFNQLKVAA